MIKSVLVVGLDGATWKVLKPLLKSNKLPFLKSLMDLSAYGVLESTTPPISAPAWVTFQTGVNPAKHGIFDFLNYRTSDGVPIINTSSEIRSKTIWDILGDYNLKSLVINMPLSYPVRKMNGIIVSSFLTPVGATFAYPKQIEKLLIEINYEIDLLIDKTYGSLPHRKLRPKDRSFYLNRLLDIAVKRVLAYKKLMKIDKYSFQFLLFKECDVAQHLFWGLSELSKFYISLDEILADLYSVYQNSSGEKNFIIISDHGFHKPANIQFSPSVFMKSSLKTEKPELFTLIWQFGSKINKNVKEIGIDPSNINIIRNLREKFLESGRYTSSKNNKVVSTSFGIYFLGGNNKQISKTVDSILEKLKQINVKHKIFDLLNKREYFYKGPYLKLLPEIIWKVNEKYTIDTSPFASKLFSRRTSKLLGEHEADPFGIYIANGKNLHNGESDNESITDIPLLILKILDIKVPWYFDGKIPNFYTEDIDEVNKLNVNKIINNEIKDL